MKSASSSRCSAVRLRGRSRRTRRFDTTEHNLRSTSVSKTSGGTIDEALAGQERKCFVSGGEGCFLSLHFLFKDLT
jgi:hypothetical protein